MKKYHWQDIKTTKARPHLPYTQKMATPIKLSVGECSGFITGVRRDGLRTTAYFIRGVYIRRRLLDRTLSVQTFYYSYLELSDADREAFETAFVATPFYTVYRDIRARSLGLDPERLTGAPELGTGAWEADSQAEN